MKKRSIFAAVLLAWGVIAVSCAKMGEIDNQIVDNENTEAVEAVTFTTSLAPKDAGTRAVDANGKTSWVVGEKIAIRYTQVGGSSGTTIANVDAVQDNGVAVISATLNNPRDDSEIKFTYPASLAKTDGDGIDPAKLANQHGTIEEISANFDAATGSGTVLAEYDMVHGIGYLGIWTTKDPVTMNNQVLIGKFKPTYSGAPISGITSLTIRDGVNAYCITPSSGTTFGTDGIYVAMLPVSNRKMTIAATTSILHYILIKEGISLNAGKLYNNLTIPMGLGADLTYVTSNYTALFDETLTGNLGANVKVSVVGNATITLDNVTINGVNDEHCKWAGITCLGNTTIILKGKNTIKGFHENYPGIQAAYLPSSTDRYTLTIQGSGSLNASSNGKGAGIGGGYYDDVAIHCDDIVILGGNITATGGEGAAGIGGGYLGACGNITISGGRVRAAGGANAAGIGGGNNGFPCGAITITEDVTRVIAMKGSGAPVSVGMGKSTSCERVTVGSEDYYPLEGEEYDGRIYLGKGKFVYPVPDGCIDALFTVNDNGKEIFISRGNLQLEKKDTWKFADHQYDFYGGEQWDNHRDLFNWGTGTNPNYIENDATAYWIFHDWGVNMGPGWRTPKETDFEYLFNSTSKYGYATVGGKKGIILLPDCFTDPMKNGGSGPFKDGSNIEYSQNVYTSGGNWEAMEASGCVFFPAAGYRFYKEYINDKGDCGLYWTSDPNGENGSSILYFESDKVQTNQGMVNYNGVAVRLVQDEN